MNNLYVSTEKIYWIELYRKGRRNEIVYFEGSDFVSLLKLSDSPSYAHVLICSSKTNPKIGFMSYQLIDQWFKKVEKNYECKK